MLLQLALYLVCCLLTLSAATQAIKTKTIHYLSNDKAVHSPNLRIVHHQHGILTQKHSPSAPKNDYIKKRISPSVPCMSTSTATWNEFTETIDFHAICEDMNNFGEIQVECETQCTSNGNKNRAITECPSEWLQINQHECQSIFTENALKTYAKECVSHYRCKQWYYYFIELKWWEFLIWQCLFVTIGCCCFGCMIGFCLRCFRNRSRAHVNGNIDIVVDDERDENIHLRRNEAGNELINIVGDDDEKKDDESDENDAHLRNVGSISQIHF